MIGVGIYRAKTEANVGTLWRAAHLYDADFLFTIGCRYRPQASDTTKAWRSIPLVNYPDVDAFWTLRPFDARVVAVELSDRATPLRRYHHPRSALYLLGAEDAGLPPSVLDRCDEVVEIECPQPRSMNVAQAGTLVLGDRYHKALDAAEARQMSRALQAAG